MTCVAATKRCQKTSTAVAGDSENRSTTQRRINKYCRKLNFAFEKEADHDFVHGYGAGYVSYANQPGCQNAHLFNYAGRPWLTQYWVRRVNQQAYGGEHLHPIG